jgi:hypothetical protein
MHISNCTMFSGYWDKIFEVLLLCLQDNDSNVRARAAKVIEDATKAVGDLESNKAPEGTPINGKTMWDRILQEVVTRCVEDPSPLVRASLCTSLSHISSLTFEVGTVTF